MTSTSQTIVISYDLRPPSGSESKTTGLSPSQKIQVPVKADGSQDLKTYYTALHDAIEEARTLVGEDLTRWRDAVGKDEASKEPKKGGKEEEEGEEEEEEEEQS
ncbi:hypothetical protein V5O48_013916 [Marasmius crinis-equi]|uniref:EKC/KEOPS complex subunit GON7 n=1 Tax=Marasmius crinis-equi TaxID=585013 RepID=A0ABR3EYS1_9AGAR